MSSRPRSFSPPATSPSRTASRPEGLREWLPAPSGRHALAPVRIGLGTWALGGAAWGTRADDEDPLRVIARAWDGGVRFFDTAPTYGEAESLLGRALAGRSEAVVATKVGQRDDPGASLHASLRRLRRDRVDLLQLHEVGERFEWSLEAMGRLLAEGKALALGVCNANADHIARAREIVPLASCQGQYNLFDREVEHGVLMACRRLDLAFLAYRPLAAGLLGRRYAKPAPAFGADDHRRRIYWFRGREFERRRRVAERLHAVGAGVGLTVAGVALAWLLARPGVSVVLAGARTGRQVDENLAAGRSTLGSADVAAIDRILSEEFRPPAATAAARRHALRWGERERFIVERLDGRTGYEAIAAASVALPVPLVTAQVKLFADRLLDLGLATADA